jgi:DNA-binding CsgD family transcriptional regulator
MTLRKGLEKTEKEYLNGVANFLITQHEKEKSETEISLVKTVELTVLPLLNKLETLKVDDGQHGKILAILENNLLDLVNNHGNTIDFNRIYNQLTRAESLVATMVAQGLPTKTIARNLNISSETVNIHRKNIRKKLSLTRNHNLYNYLKSLNDCETSKIT